MYDFSRTAFQNTGHNLGRLSVPESCSGNVITSCRFQKDPGPPPQLLHRPICRGGNETSAELAESGLNVLEPDQGICSIGGNGWTVWVGEARANTARPGSRRQSLHLRAATKRPGFSVRPNMGFGPRFSPSATRSVSPVHAGATGVFSIEKDARSQAIRERLSAE